MNKDLNYYKSIRVANYQGYWIVKSCGYFYPEVNGNIESKDIMVVKEYLRDRYIPARDGINKILGLSLINSYLYNS